MLVVIEHDEIVRKTSVISELQPARTETRLLIYSASLFSHLLTKYKCLERTCLIFDYYSFLSVY